MKQKILGTRLGSLILNVRNRMELLAAVFSSVEKLGCLSNDYLASKLVTLMTEKGETFIDIGAHIGSVTAEVILNNPDVNVVAIEAIPDKAEKLKDKFPQIIVHQCALGASTQTVKFYINTKLSGYSSLHKPTNTSQIDEISVQMKKLDDLDGFNAIHVMKVDVEGAELGVFKGARHSISENRPLIMFESAPRPVERENEIIDIWDWFASMEYILLIPNRVAHNGGGLDLAGFIDSHCYPRRTTNYFAVPCEKREIFKHRARKALGVS